jgi:hypothetical protein
MFPKLSNAKLKERIFVGPQIRKIVKDPLFEEKFNHIELSAWRSFKNVIHDFLGNKKAENYEEIIIVIIHQGREDIFLSRGSLFPEKRRRGLKLSSLPWCIYYFFHY